MEIITQFGVAIVPIVGGLIGVAAAFVTGRKKDDLREYVPGGLVMLVGMSSLPVLSLQGVTGNLDWVTFVSTSLMVVMCQASYYAVGWSRSRKAGVAFPL